MSDNAPVSPETMAEPSLAELFDPAALERRLTEARARRAEALARRAAAGEAGGAEPAAQAQGRRPRIHTIDMATLSAPGSDTVPAPAAFAEASAAVPLSLVTALSPRRLQPSAPQRDRSAVRPPTPQPPLLGEARRGGSSMPERLAVAVARPPAPSEAPASARALAPWHRQPLAVLGLGLFVGALAAVGTLVITRTPAPAPPAAAPPAVARTVALAQPALRFGVPVPGAAGAPDTEDLGYGLPGEGAPTIAPVADAAPAAPDDKSLPETDMAEMRVRAVPDTSVEAPAAVPDLPRDSTVAALSAVEVLPPLALGPDRAPTPPTDTALREPMAVIATTASADRRSPTPSLPRTVTPEALPSIAAEAAPNVPLGGADDKTPPALRFATDTPDAYVGAALRWPAGQPSPSVEFALLTPPASGPSAPSNAERRTERRAAPVAERPRNQAAGADRPAATPARTAVAEAVARARLERSIEDMLRDRLLDN